MKPVWTYPPEPADKGHLYRQLARTLGIEMWNLQYTRRQRQKKTVQAATVNKSLQFRRRLAIFLRQCGDCHLSPCTFRSTTKFAAKVSLSLRIFRAGKPVDDSCKLSLYRVCVLWTCEFSWNNFLFVITKRSIENIYCDGRSNIRRYLNNGWHVSYLLEFVMILTIRFLILKILTL